MDYTLIVKVLMGGLLGGLVGLERELARKVAGMRTHALVALASSFFTALSVDVVSQFAEMVAYDPSRIISNIIVGIGFIGAGAIFRNGDKVEGTTTAASLWATASIGVATGLGLFKEATMVAVIIFLTLQAVWVIEKKLRAKLGPLYKRQVSDDLHEASRQ